MKLTLITCLLPLLALADRPATFNVADGNVECGRGSTIFPSDAPAKGNFATIQNKIIPYKISKNCHISLYPKDNQQGGVSQRLTTEWVGYCMTGGAWKSYGYYCD
ncbi:hypothetical protein BCR34DRAFT_585455 [Clohesyomyces aquaticus]|uniref:Uncharacterized protein n=1 Tax=Clohesyomyces aquaticus TaxID=1231657 RepID=A0A1Y1ZXV8_9PLEO|nr:hypothetical protein BCR34DRAFT_585455 [Clohesyomyces aquaticus]